MFNFIYNFYNSHIWLCQIIVATLIGAIIGIERELKGKSAGIRTYSLICLSSCLFTICSRWAGGDHDSTRIAAQIVVGCSFVSGGLIWHNDKKIEGLTTASSVWLVSAIGMCVGYGFMSLAFSAVIIGLIIMETFGVIMERLKKLKGE